MNKIKCYETTLLWNKTIPCLFVDPIYVMIEDAIARNLTR